MDLRLTYTKRTYTWPQNVGTMCSFIVNEIVDMVMKANLFACIVQIYFCYIP